MSYKDTIINKQDMVLLATDGIFDNISLPILTFLINVINFLVVKNNDSEFIKEVL